MILRRSFLTTWKKQHFPEWGSMIPLCSKEICDICWLSIFLIPKSPQSMVETCNLLYWDVLISYLFVVGLFCTQMFAGSVYKWRADVYSTVYEATRRVRAPVREPVSWRQSVPENSVPDQGNHAPHTIDKHAKYRSPTYSELYVYYSTISY